MVLAESNKTENVENHRQGRFYRFLRKMILIFTKPMKTVWEVPFEGKPSVFVCNHDRAFGPIAMCAHFELSNAAQYVIIEVRRQFKEIPGIMTGKAKPDYAKCVDIVTKGALHEMVLPGLIVVLVPILVGVILGREAAGAYLLVCTIVGVIVALFLNNSGGAWDNAKKYVEMGFGGGKGSETHKAAVVGDTVGDPFKDTAGPSLHVLIKLTSTLLLLFIVLFTH